MSEDRTLDTLRAMAWERAKGELESMLQTFYPTYTDNENKFEETSETIKEFIRKMEDDIGV